MGKGYGNEHIPLLIPSEVSGQATTMRTIIISCNKSEGWVLNGRK